jgi:hypothetical protein
MEKKILCVILALLLACSLSVAWATPMPAVTYLETEISGGFWQYNFTVANTSDDPDADAGFDIFYVLLKLGEVLGLNVIRIPLLLPLPAGWDCNSGTGDSSSPDAFISLTSLFPGAPPEGADIAPGTSLGGFVFEFDAKLEEILFETLTANWIDPENPIYFADNATPGNAVPIPEPATLALVSAGLAGMGLYTRRKRIRQIEG